jgi:hypothetical protein
MYGRMLKSRKESHCENFGCLLLFHFENSWKRVTACTRRSYLCALQILAWGLWRHAVPELGLSPFYSYLIRLGKGLQSRVAGVGCWDSHNTLSLVLRIWRMPSALQYSCPHPPARQSIYGCLRSERTIFFSKGCQSFVWTTAVTRWDLNLFLNSVHSFQKL